MSAIFLSCSDDSKDPGPFQYDDGGFIRFQDNPKFALNVTDLNSQDAIFKSTLIDPIGNADLYELYLSAIISGVEYDSVLFKSIEEFPAEFNISPSDLASALGLDVSDLGGGDVFFFDGQVTTDDGRVYAADPAPNYDDEEGYNGGLTSVTLIEEPGYRDAFQFTINYVCPFNQANSAGSYEITNDGFEGAFDTDFEVIAGPGANQITMVNPYGHPELPGEDYQIVITVDEASGVASVALQGAMDSGVFGLPYGLISVSTQGPSFVFSCNGTIDLTLGFFIPDGRTFGNYKLVAKKVQ